MIFDAVNTIGASKGDLVVIQSETGPVMKAVGVFYVLPMVLFFLFYYLGTFLNAPGIVGGLGFALGIAIAVVYDRKVAQKDNTVHTITGYAGDYLLRSMNKGDN